jgi:transposase
LDLKHVIKKRFGVDYDARYVGKLLHRLGFAKLSVRPQHPAQDTDIIEAFKKIGHAR